MDNIRTYQPASEYMLITVERAEPDPLGIADESTGATRARQESTVGESMLIAVGLLLRCQEYLSNYEYSK